MYIECPDLSEKRFVAFQTAISNNIFTFLFRWNEYCDCCFLTIQDYKGENIVSSVALTTNSCIFSDHRVLPQLKLSHKYGLTYEPTNETMKDYVLSYEDTAK